MSSARPLISIYRAGGHIWPRPSSLSPKVGNNIIIIIICLMLRAYCMTRLPSTRCSACYFLFNLCNKPMRKILCLTNIWRSWSSEILRYLLLCSAYSWWEVTQRLSSSFLIQKWTLLKLYFITFWKKSHICIFIQLFKSLGIPCFLIN